jgi:hypothetical protein
MKKTILFYIALVVTHSVFGQGSKAQMDTQQDANGESNQQNVVHTRSKAQLDASRSAAWQLKKKNASPTQPATISEYATVHHSAAINQFFKQRMIVPAPSTAQLLTQTPQSHIAAASTYSGSNAEIAQSGEKLFTNEEATISSIYPNPASGYAFIDYSLSGSVRESRVVLYNVLGSPVSEYVLSRDERKLRISTFGLESGFYYYTLFVDGKSLVTRRLVVKH